ncbi:hypothetical protein ACS0TY_000647 [Phlomoides rotata]
MSTTTSIPLGFRFDPSDDELIGGFLIPRLSGGSLPWDGILECDLYCEAPWNIFDESSPYWQKPKRVDKSKVCKKSMYVFTRLKKASARKISRIAGCGTWDGQTGSSKVKDLTGKVIGSTRMFRYQGGMDMNNSFGNWIMHEYVAEEAKDDDLVLCKITNSTSANQIPVVVEYGSKLNPKKQKVDQNVDQIINNLQLNEGSSHNLSIHDLLNFNDEDFVDIFSFDELLNWDNEDCVMIKKPTTKLPTPHHMRHV